MRGCIKPRKFADSIKKIRGRGMHNNFMIKMHEQQDAKLCIWYLTQPRNYHQVTTAPRHNNKYKRKKLKVQCIIKSSPYCG